VNPKTINREALAWRIATKSSSGNCVEVAVAEDMIAIRHSKRPYSELILYTFAEFEAFVDGIKKGEFDDMITG
jgi:hypothetical protein